MADDSMGVILILVLGGLVVPIALILGAALFDAALIAWTLVRSGVDGVRARAGRLTHRRPGLPPVRPAH